MFTIDEITEYFEGKFFISHFDQKIISNYQRMLQLEQLFTLMTPSTTSQSNNQGLEIVRILEKYDQYKYKVRDIAKVRGRTSTRLYWYEVVLGALVYTLCSPLPHCLLSTLYFRVYSQEFDRISDFSSEFRWCVRPFRKNHPVYSSIYCSLKLPSSQAVEKSKFIHYES